MKSKFLKTAYSISITILAIISIILAVLDIAGKIPISDPPYKQIDTGILLIFVADYAVRFVRADDRKAFFKQNIPDLLAIIPFSSMFSALRVFRVLRIAKASRLLKFTRLIRAGALTAKIRRRISGVLKTNGLVYLLYVNGALVLAASGVMMCTEGMTFPDALWWSIVTCTTVGYGDISPSTALGRITAVILMMFGIGFIGMLTSSITTYFTTHHEPERQKDDTLEALLASASDEDRQKIYEIAKIILSKEDAS